MSPAGAEGPPGCPQMLLVPPLRRDRAAQGGPRRWAAAAVPFGGTRQCLLHRASPQPEGWRSSPPPPNDALRQRPQHLLACCRARRRGAGGGCWSREAGLVLLERGQQHGARGRPAGV